MDLEFLRMYCLSKPGTSEETPFDPTTLVFKVMGKMFCLTDLSMFDRLNVKADPEQAIAWRETYSQVTPGWHMNKTHWNTVLLEGMPKNVILQMIDHSYEEVVRKLPKKVQQELNNKE